jgi:hypothetical protein
MLLALTVTGVAPPEPEPEPEPEPGTVLTSGAWFSKRKWRELMALIAAEEAARRRQLESEAARKALQPATSAAEAVIGISQVAGIMPDEIRQSARSC